MLKIAKKYLLAFPKEKEIEVLDLLEKEGSLELIKSSQSQSPGLLETISQKDYLISSLEFAIDYLTPFVKKPSLKDKLKNPFISINLPKILAKQEELISQVKRVEKIERNIDLLQREQKEKGQVLNDLAKFGQLSFLPQETEATFSLTAGLNQISFRKLSDFCLKNKIYQKVLSSFVNKRVFLFVGLKENKADFLVFLQKEKAEIYLLPYGHPPIKEKQIIEERLSEISKSLEIAQDELKILSRSLSDFKALRDVSVRERTKLAITEQTLQSNFLSYVLFFAFEKETKKTEKALKKITSEISLIESTLAKGEEPPLALEQNKFLAPFQYVTEIFGLPLKNEIDPTPYHAFFFILFFGICITDAGYGLLLALFTLLPLLLFKNLFKDTKLIKLLFYGGISTFIMGTIFGSYFGLSSAVVAKIPFFNRLKLIDPIEDTLLFMEFAFALGFLQVCFSQVVKMISGKKNKNKEMLLSGLAWLSFYLAGLFLFLAFIKLPLLKNIGFSAILLTAVFLLYVESIGQKIFLKPLVGFIKFLQGLIGAVSDILSYSRLMALGLATAVIALIVNQIAGMMKDMIPFVGWGIAVLILIGGHLFNLAINALGSFIHSGRLQFVEFFPKFLEGGGRRFNPIKSNLKYSKVD